MTEELRSVFLSIFRCVMCVCLQPQELSYSLPEDSLPNFYLVHYSFGVKLCALFSDTVCSSPQIWDTRQRSCSHEFNAHEDYISGMTFASDSMKLVVTRFGFL